METRFRFCFESGPREHEWISLAIGTCSIGRLPKNTVQIADSSVSGRHAEFQVHSDAVTLVDLGSTNGTRVEGDKIESLLLGHGDRLQFGSIRAYFHDAEAPGASQVPSPSPQEEPAARQPASTSSSASARPPAAQEAASRVSAEALARSGSGSKVGLLALLFAILGGAGFAAWMLLGKPGSDAAGQAAILEPIAGNLLGDYSFEAEGLWTNAEAAPQAFFVDRSFALSGIFGMGILLDGAEWGIAASSELPLAPGQALQLSGFLSARNAALGRLGIELLASRPGEASVIAWAAASGAPDFTESLLGFMPPSGFKSARVLMAALGVSGQSEVAFDDVSLVQGGLSAQQPLVFEEYELSVLGAGGCNAILSRSGRILFSSISTSSWGFDGLVGEAQSGWSARLTDSGFELSLGAAAGPGTRCELLAADFRPLSPDGSGPAYLASMGQGGYRSHVLGFRREAASHLLAGGGANLMRFSTGAQSTLSAQNRAGQPLLALEMDGSRTLTLQLDFDQERGAAESLALRARSAASAQRSGEALGAWSELLSKFPIDGALIAEAESVRARILSEGHASIEALELSLESADFFQLRDAYGRCREDALSLGKDYQGTELEDKAKSIVARIDAAQSALESGGRVGHVERLKGVLSALDSLAQPELAARLNEALADHMTSGEDPRK